MRTLPFLFTWAGVYSLKLLSFTSKIFFIWIVLWWIHRSNYFRKNACYKSSCDSEKNGFAYSRQPVFSKENTLIIPVDKLIWIVIKNQYLQSVNCLLLYEPANFSGHQIRYCPEFRILTELRERCVETFDCHSHVKTFAGQCSHLGTSNSFKN